MISADPTVSRPFVPRDLSEIKIKGYVRVRDNTGQVFSSRRFDSFRGLKKLVERVNEIDKPDGVHKFITVMFDEKQNNY